MCQWINRLLVVSLDPDQKEELVTVLDKLLSDRTTLVVGSAVMAFDEARNNNRIFCKQCIVPWIFIAMSMSIPAIDTKCNCNYSFIYLS